MTEPTVLDLRNSHKHTLRALVELCEGESKLLTQADIESVAFISNGTLWRVLNDLEAWGYIQRQGIGAGAPYTYTVLCGEFA